MRNARDDGSSSRRGCLCSLKISMYVAYRLRKGLVAHKSLLAVRQRCLETSGKPRSASTRTPIAPRVLGSPFGGLAFLLFWLVCPPSASIQLTVRRKLDPMSPPSLALHSCRVVRPSASGTARQPPLMPRILSPLFVLKRLQFSLFPSAVLLEPAAKERAIDAPASSVRPCRLRGRLNDHALAG